MRGAALAVRVKAKKTRTMKMDLFIMNGELDLFIPSLVMIECS